MKTYLLLCIFTAISIVISLQSFCQVGINTDNSQPDPSAVLDLKSTNKGLLPPRVSLTAINSTDPITSPAIGLLVYNTANAGAPPNNVVPGYYYWNGTNWISVAVPAGTNVGDMLYWNGTQWIGVPVGTNGQVLTLNNGVPTWGQPSAQLPAIITTTASEITLVSAISGGNVSDGGAVVTARGICWSTSQNPTISDSKTINGSGTGTFISNLTGLSFTTTYHIRAYATNNIGTAYGNDVNFTTLSNPCSSSSSLTINHVAGAIAPVDKTVTYVTVLNIPGETSKCWITSNLGSDHQAIAVDDATEASAGWYWQFNRKQGYMHDGISRTPNSTWITPITEDSDWAAANDPCALELGNGWRIPTSTEWINVNAFGNWTNWNDPWNSELKLHAAGDLKSNTGSLYNRGTFGVYWSSTQNSHIDSWKLIFTISSSYVNTGSEGNKASGLPLRCINGGY
jgi:hypothetical protein